MLSQTPDIQIIETERKLAIKALAQNKLFFFNFARYAPIGLFYDPKGVATFQSKPEYSEKHPDEISIPITVLTGYQAFLEQKINTIRDNPNFNRENSGFNYEEYDDLRERHSLLDKIFAQIKNSKEVPHLSRIKQTIKPKTIQTTQGEYQTTLFYTRKLEDTFLGPSYQEGHEYIFTNNKENIVLYKPQEMDRHIFRGIFEGAILPNIDKIDDISSIITQNKKNLIKELAQKSLDINIIDFDDFQSISF